MRAAVLGAGRASALSQRDAKPHWFSWPSRNAQELLMTVIRLRTRVTPSTFNAIYAARSRRVAVLVVPESVTIPSLALTSIVVALRAADAINAAFTLTASVLSSTGLRALARLTPGACPFGWALSTPPILWLGSSAVGARWQAPIPRASAATSALRTKRALPVFTVGNA